MFEKSASWNRLSGGPRKVLAVHLGYVPELDSDTRAERRAVKLAVALALAGHLGFFLVKMPALRAVELDAGPARPVYVVKQVRFKPPPPRAEQVVPQKQVQKKKIPIPDPTPDEPEPFLVDEIEMPEVVAPEDALFGIPDAPPGPPVAGAGPDGPYRLGGEVVAPEKIYYPSPGYTEEARLARIQGVVILEAVIDANGNVASVKVLKGLPMGLTESAVETAKKWTFKPARRDGEPIAVYLNLSVRFSLQ